MQRISYCALIGILLTLASCKRFFDASVPDGAWPLFESPKAIPIGSDVLRQLEGVYSITGQDDDFGDSAVIRWSYIIEKDTVHYLSIFCKEDVRYFVCTAKKLDSNILISGYWRNVENRKTGRAQLIINRAAEESTGANKMRQLMISGMVGMGDEEPADKIQFTYHRPLYTGKYMHIIAHRGGGRNSDLLPASENSVELIKLASVYGANGIEIDVKLTRDGVAVLYHDDLINDRLTNKVGVRGPLSDYTYAALQNDIRLKDNQQIPTLRAALETVLYQTPIEYVWLDAKDAAAISICRAMQKEFTERAAKANRKLEITLGIPTEEVMKAFQQLPQYQAIPSISELSPMLTKQIHANIWAQSWTKGFQEEDVAMMQREGRRVFIWTLDVPKLIKFFLREGPFDGIVTNRPSIAAYYHFSQQ